jgi:hypothetical protein
MEIQLENGKYTVVNDNGKLSALWYEQPWRDLTGDGLILAMVHEIHDLQTKLKELTAEIDNIKQVEFPKRLNNVTKSIIAERDKLREKLAQFTSSSLNH